MVPSLGGKQMELLILSIGILGISIFIGWMLWRIWRKTAKKPTEGFQLGSAYTDALQNDPTFNNTFKQSINPNSTKFCSTLLDSEKTLTADIANYRAKGETENQKAHEEILAAMVARINLIGCRSLSADQLKNEGSVRPAPLETISREDVAKLLAAAGLPNGINVVVPR